MIENEIDTSCSLKVKEPLLNFKTPWGSGVGAPDGAPW